MLQDACNNLKKGRYKNAIEIYDKLSKQCPRNHWIRLNAVYACIKMADYDGASRRLELLTESEQLGEPLIQVYKSVILKRNRNGNTSPYAIKSAADYYRLIALGNMLPQFENIKAKQKFASRYYPFDLILPKIPGNGNDFRFLLEAVHQNQNMDFSKRPGKPLGVVVWVETREQLERFRQGMEMQTLPRSEFTITVFSETEVPDPAEWAEHCFRVRPWRLKLDEQEIHFPTEVETFLFVDGSVTFDSQLLERVVRYASVSPSIFLKLANFDIADRQLPYLNFFTEKPLAEKYWRERFPFRNIKPFGFAVNASLMREIGGFDPRFTGYLHATMELAYRAYNRGAYFIPLAADISPEGDGIVSERLENKSDKVLFQNLCPVHWYRKKDGRYEVPKVSVYIPAYNASRFIRQAIDSVLCQDFEDIEVCVHVDGSPDDTLALLERYYGDNPQVRWEHGRNGGIGYASNRAVSMCRGLYIGQLDSDDRLKSGAIRKLAEYLDNHGDIGCVYSSCERVDANGKFIKNEYSFPVFSREKMLLTSITHHFRMFRRQAWERTHHFREDIVNAVDYDMFLKLSEVTKFHHINEILYQRRWHGGNTSSINEDKQTRNTYAVQTKSLKRMGLADKWHVHVPESDNPRLVTYKRTPGRKRIFFWPDYSHTNPYQKLLYASSRMPCDFLSGDIDSAIMAASKASDPENVIFHLHWLTSLIVGAKTETDLINLLENFYRKLVHFKNSKGKIVWTVHNTISHDAKYPDVERNFSNKIVALCDRIHIHSDKSLSEIKSMFELPTRKVRVSRHGCYHATYPDYITPAFAREQLAIDPQDTVILFFGQFRPYKGFDLLLDAFSELRDKGYKIKLLAAGQAKFDVKPKLVKHLGEDACNVLLVDRVIDDNEVQVFFRAADIAVFPYRNILTSGSLMLSLTFGLPPVIPAVGMTQEVLQGQDAGFLYGLDAPYPSLQVAVEAALKRKEDGSWDNVRSNCESLGRSLDWPVFVDTVLDF